MNPVVNTTETKSFHSRIQSLLKGGVNFQNAAEIARELGSHVISGTQSARFFMWHPRFKKAERVEIGLYLPKGELIYDKPDQHLTMTFYLLETEVIDEYALAVVDNLPSGNREQFGAFYHYLITYPDGSTETVRDPIAWSMPYGIYAPAELYDIESVLEKRKDAAYFRKLAKEAEKDEFKRVQPSTNLLEVHTATATAEGTLRSLARRYRQIAETIKAGKDLQPEEQNLLGFDGIELMPIEPVIEHPENHAFWKQIQKPGKSGDEVTLHLQKPSVINWGYDIVIFGSAAVNPSILSTGRPHELLDLIETLHNFPAGPIKVILDVVYGHADNQGTNVLPDEFFAGPNMYGLNIDFKNPIVRAMILEMQRRKIDWGFDGVRVDGAQDFKYYVPEKDELLHDDEFLEEMSEVEQNVAGVTYKPWMIFEDGRPWPRDDWELASTYREITDQQKHPFQWAPMIFAYNTPYNYTYWVSKWWRLKEQFVFGEKWISGYANHDTMRRGTQANPENINVNFLLGNSLKMVMDNAYNNPSTTLLMNAFLPGVPMDFVQALGNTPWSFIRNTDTAYSIKVTAEEAHFTEWQITENDYRNPRFFKRLKAMGFTSLEGLRRFAKALLNLVKATDYNQQAIAKLLANMEPPFSVMGWDTRKLEKYAVSWTEDLHDYCNAELHYEFIDSRKAAFNLKTREYRLNNSWLAGNFTAGDFLKYREPVDGAVIFYGYRRNPKTGKEIIFLANMEGQPSQVVPAELGLPIKKGSEWKVVLSTPSVRAKDIHQPIRLSISQGMLFERSS
ncbi:MAG: hypothetical protein EA391_14375 [Balneolaceae bacterium]|nr:MAG: hypothetical protein EA391_14375 [Balneolaceae bacterium]